MLARLFPARPVPDVSGGPWARVTSVLGWVRVVGALAALGGAALLGSELDVHRGAFELFVAMYLPYALLIRARPPRTKRMRRVTIGVDLLTLFFAHLAIPEIQFLVLIAYLLVQTYATTGGLAVGLTVGVTAWAFAFTAEQLDPIPEHRTFTLVMYGVMLVFNAFIVDAATREHRLRQRRATDEELTTVSHELKNTLQTIEGFTEMLASRWEELDGPTRKIMLGRIASSSGELEELVESLHEISVIGAGGWRAHAESRLLRGCVEGFVEANRPMIGDHPVIVSVPEGLAVAVDPFACRRVFGNLLSNAAKFSPAGSPIEVGARVSGDEVVVSVTDHGPGVPPADRARIFEPFYRGGGSALAPGSGLGLSLVVRYVEAMGGRVWLEPSESGGATFSFTLSRARPEAKRLAV